MMKRRRRFKQTLLLEDRLTAEAVRLREKAQEAPPGSSENSCYGGRVNAKPART
ncbi:hypothetical protein [Bradyrhizobium sp. 1(2017)]|uniref:hypothetical protein n=1 Tax=Bradyrhizobium sp. 1(2017) TaxID=1404888 RepID=UPI0039C8AA6D